MHRHGNVNLTVWDVHLLHHEFFFDRREGAPPANTISNYDAKRLVFKLRPLLKIHSMVFKQCSGVIKNGRTRVRKRAHMGRTHLMRIPEHFAKFCRCVRSHWARIVECPATFSAYTRKHKLMRILVQFNELCIGMGT